MVTDTNTKAADISVPASVTPIAVRMMAIVQVSVFEAVNAITGRYPAYRAKMTPAPGASVDAAVAAATRTALSKLMPAQQAAIDADYQALLAPIPDGSAKTSGIAVGEQAANAIVASCADDGMVAPTLYRPRTTAGVYVPTAMPGGAPLGQAPTLGDGPRRPVPPGPPPSLTSDAWARDYNEIKALGSKNSTQRTPEQTAIARVLGGDGPGRLLAGRALGRDRARRATSPTTRACSRWRRWPWTTGSSPSSTPSTPTTSGARSPPSATGTSTATMPPDRDPGWTPFIDTPMHPEYPCAHCIVSASLGAVLEAEIGAGPTPTLQLGQLDRRAAPCARGRASATSRRRSPWRAHPRRGALPQFDRRSARRWGRRSAKQAVTSFHKPTR